MIPPGSRPRTPDPARPAPGRPKDPAKRAAILAAAQQLFTAQGLDGVSMDQIAATAGVSKLTVYSHFGDKEALFAATVRAVCEAQMPPDLFIAKASGPLRKQLLAIAHAFFKLITSDQALAMHRLMMTPGSEPRIREMFWAAGPARVQAAFAEFLEGRVAEGELAVPDIPRAASQFFCLLRGELHARMACGLGPRPTRSEVDAHVEATVELFLRAHAPPR